MSPGAGPVYLDRSCSSLLVFAPEALPVRSIGLGAVCIEERKSSNCFSGCFFSIVFFWEEGCSCMTDLAGVLLAEEVGSLGLLKL